MNIAMVNSKEFQVHSEVVEHESLGRRLTELMKDGWKFMPPPNQSILPGASVGDKDYATILVMR